MWARVHKIDRIRPVPGGGAIVLIEDERRAAAMARIPSLSVLIAIARVLNARRALASRYGGKGEVRYAAAATPPPPLLEAITRAGASVSDASGERVTMPASPAGLAAVIDASFAELAHHVRTNSLSSDMGAALRAAEAARRKAPLDREANPAGYWTAVFELTALAGELSRAKGGRWIETAELPMPFAVRFPGGEFAAPAKLAQRIVEGGDPLESMATEVEPLSSPQDS
ncbi:MAG TPA: hypothetical protein VNO30_46755 [Kofleriaceae bacterium]|nr:hypothetical protein [Kofleriaceae bacterium]